jgi:hypothetical protein
MTNLDRPVKHRAWVLLGAVMLLVFIAFISLDPTPDVLLAGCAAFNAGLILGGIYFLYAWDLLLSPMASVLIGPGWFFYYSLGNLGARVAGEGRYGSNPGSLDYYPLAALLSTIGLTLFVGLIFGVFRKHVRYYRLRYSDLYWEPWQALTTSLLAIGVLGYLSFKYEFIGGYFRGVEGAFDQWLSASQYFFVTLTVVCSTSALLRARTRRGRMMALIGIGLPIIIALGLRSRTFMVTTVVLIALCWLTLRPRGVPVVLAGAALLALGLFSTGTLVKVASVSGETASILDNLAVLQGGDTQQLIDLNQQSAGIDSQYRLAGLEFPAALLHAYDLGAQPMYGAAMQGGLLSALPGFLRPAGDSSERLATFRHFYGQGLVYGDSIGIPLVSGLSDWGLVLAPLIYILFALYCLIVWRVAQLSPRLFVAYLMAGVTVGDLFWENGLFALRGIAFAWLVLLIGGRLLMPRWEPGKAVEGQLEMDRVGAPGSDLLNSNPDVA